MVHVGAILELMTCKYVGTGSAVYAPFYRVTRKAAVFARRLPGRAERTSLPLIWVRLQAAAKGWAGCAWGGSIHPLVALTSVQRVASALGAARGSFSVGARS